MQIKNFTVSHFSALSSNVKSPSPHIIALEPSPSFFPSSLHWNPSPTCFMAPYLSSSPQNTKYSQGCKHIGSCYWILLLAERSLAQGNRGRRLKGCTRETLRDIRTLQWKDTCSSSYLHVQQRAAQAICESNSKMKQGIKFYGWQIIWQGNKGCMGWGERKNSADIS